jgi:hypothetical protein
MKRIGEVVLFCLAISCLAFTTVLACHTSFEFCEGGNSWHCSYLYEDSQGCHYDCFIYGPCE